MTARATRHRYTRGAADRESSPSRSCAFHHHERSIVAGLTGREAHELIGNGRSDHLRRRVGFGVNPANDVALFENVASAVLGFSETIGKQRQDITRVELDALFGVSRILESTEHEARRVERTPLAAGAPE